MPRFAGGGRYRPKRDDDYVGRLEKAATHQRLGEPLPGNKWKWRVFTREKQEPEVPDIAKVVYDGPGRDNLDRGGKHRWLVYIPGDPPDWSDEAAQQLQDAQRIDAALKADSNVVERYMLTGQSDHDYEADY